MLPVYSVSRSKGRAPRYTAFYTKIYPKHSNAHTHTSTVSLAQFFHGRHPNTHFSLGADISGVPFFFSKIIGQYGFLSQLLDLQFALLKHTFKSYSSFSSLYQAVYQAHPQSPLSTARPKRKNLHLHIKSGTFIRISDKM